jgi:hypothetical protein
MAATYTLAASTIAGKFDCEHERIGRTYDEALKDRKKWDEISKPRIN